MEQKLENMKKYSCSILTKDQIAQFKYDQFEKKYNKYQEYYQEEYINDIQFTCEEYDDYSDYNSDYDDYDDYHDY